MSGGQKQRIQIARSMYEDADIYLFDDPFSAVDAQTGSHIFKNSIMGILKDKTVLYVTHQVESLPAADLILVMQDGKIVQKGKFDDLLQQNIGFEAIVGAHSQALESVTNAESTSGMSSDNQKYAYSKDEFDTESTMDDSLQNTTKQESAHDLLQDSNEKGRLTQDEEREKGGIGKKVYWTYLRAVHGGALVPLMIAAQSFFQMLQIASNYWMVAWPIFAILVPIMVASFLCQRYQIPTVRELSRLSQIQRAPILHHFAESLSGASRRKKVGIVGRTGSGKSTFVQALFRIVEPREGTIEIDNIDICKIGLHDLRGRISIIPQDPTMFEGTVRGNLDPLNEYTDQRVWEVLDKCQLGNLVRQNQKKLDSTVVENGENWSVGQRQLFCLGRVLLKRSNLLVLDEATASVDSSTDAIIQDTIRSEFRDCTVLTVAHRIHTVVDSDLILVFSEGRIVEYDTPSTLLKNKNSEFSKLVKEYSRRSHHFRNRGNN
ncbi:hypothetical protein PR202_ga20528 [Eleusine coracana subsp. coracana]|uniref:ABC transporter domain-containing protein n=1 Tax=Eleusine coracana subsp. coracana TaxID=191504 RepID=A0AAV5CWX0_ELECO|nr:hypothetical protein PR202_ga20528 [Eleusine coracana subsp. coracana]